MLNSMRLRGAIPTLTKKSLATLDGEIADPEIIVKLQMREVHDAHT